MQLCWLVKEHKKLNYINRLSLYLLFFTPKDQAEWSIQYSGAFLYSWDFPKVLSKMTSPPLKDFWDNFYLKLLVQVIHFDEQGVKHT